MATPAQRLVTEASLATAVAGTAPKVHPHAISDVTNLETRLAALEQDTGWRNISSLLANAFTGVFLARRVGKLVHLAWRLDGTASTGITVINLPTMLAPSLPVTTPSVLMRFPTDPVTGGDDATLGEVEWMGIQGVALTLEVLTRTASINGSVVYTTTQAWSTTFPGVAA